MSSEIPEIFKALLEYPFSIPNFDDENDKEKLCTGEGMDGIGAIAGMGPSAALTPAIWDKTIPYNGDSFHLEYMDLEEFLIENGISANIEEGSKKSPSEGESVAEAETSSPVSSVVSKAELLPFLELEHCEEEVVTGESGSATEEECMTPEPVDPDEIEVEVNFEPDPTDLVLSSVPGGELFNPRKHRFSSEDLKPQPMIKKAKKVYVPDEQKNDKYWERRKKNNFAAKRSRDARRLKENQITVRAAFLERENTALRQEVAELRKENGRFKNTMSSYKAKYGPLAPAEDL
ncbi:TEF transcription factor, PAR bZIP family member a isoform X2 [Clupea harengus]|uniref:TEF transcription factor, PAR bZIP family member a isoform X2 n=1 Tax=Clupea harengus TaxID=7950 RepID=A0A6P3VEG3_CLUHA|nr:TEF transcription factor, PAR bZIP family member a isoform X2 [Clupea harengus]